MPIHVDIKINDKLINSLHIGRLRGGTKWDDINDYLVIEGDAPMSFSDWEEVGVPFQHRYGDGAEVCVMKAIQAIKSVEKNDYEDVTSGTNKYGIPVNKFGDTDYINRGADASPAEKARADAYDRRVEEAKSNARQLIEQKKFYAMTAEEFFAYLDKLEEEDAENKNS